MLGACALLAFHVTHCMHCQPRLSDCFLQFLNGIIKVSLEQGAVCVLESVLCHHHGMSVVD